MNYIIAELCIFCVWITSWLFTWHSPLQTESVENTKPYLIVQPEILLSGSLWDFGRTRRESNGTRFHKLCMLLRQTLQRSSALKCKRCSHWWRQGQWQTDADVFAWIWAFKASTHPWDCAEHSCYCSTARVPPVNTFLSDFYRAPELSSTFFQQWKNRPVGTQTQSVLFRLRLSVLIMVAALWNLSFQYSSSKYLN